MEHIVINSMKGMIIYNNKVLILKRALETNFGGGNWEFPGGKLEFGEELIDGLKREIHEETGLTVEVKKILFATSFRIHENKQVIIMNYLCQSNTSKVELSDEHTDFMWADKKELLIHLDKRILKDINENHILNQINIA
ncbi:MAG: hydrolase [Anaerocolumna sp.]|jgi:8-oxo-dGTP diphosphatase|nr:hydrolase [Anaerocolumna sp.]